MNQPETPKPISRGVLLKAPNTLNNYRRAQIHISNASTLFEDTHKVLRGYLPESDRPGIVIDLNYTLRHLRYLLHDGTWATLPEKPCYDRGDIGFDLDMSEAEKMTMNELRPTISFECRMIKERLQQLKDTDRTMGLYDTVKEVATQAISYAANLGS